ncbi:MAG: hypothetical protein A2X59_02870 [Nitrospirae bacterium GWC2_42_7]|nr:MAG: hypothetical protein A2X59_02870 [Nitrospirae bacterium GWC2_42_7]
MVGSAMAGKKVKPEDGVKNSNGFLTGAHYNLNIHGKKDGYNCDAESSGGNSVFVPENGEGIQILMQSGNKSLATTMEVVDKCAEAFDLTPIVINLPYNKNGFYVFARPLGKPTKNPSMGITPDVISVTEGGSDLFYLGFVNSKGFKNPYAELIRSKGKSKAVDITGLFQWSGSVCYLSSDSCTPIEECTITSLCCTDADLDGVYEGCTTPPEPIPPATESICPIDTVWVDTYCMDYEEEWVFNIGDLVDYMWDIDNSGLKLLQIRFYPVPEE